MGMWAFIAQEILFFGGHFGAYTVYRNLYTRAFVEGSHHLPIFWGCLNTVVLIASSLTVALAVRGAQLGRRMATFNWMIATMILGFAFLGVKAIEYKGKYDHHLIPTASFVYEDVLPAGVTQGQMKIFFSLYFVLTGMHALHMIIGIGIMLWLLPKIRRGIYNSEYFSPIENCEKIGFLKNK